MTDALVVFASLSQMNFVKRSFRAEGRYFDAVRTPACIASKGCSHAIQCARAEVPALLLRAESLRIEVRGAYAVIDNEGCAEYLPLTDAERSREEYCDDLSRQRGDVLAETAVRH